MRLRAALLLLILLASSGCVAKDDGEDDDADDVAATPTSPATATSPKELYNATLSFSLGTAGRQPLEVPAGLTALTLSGTWHSDTPQATTANILVQLKDSAGTVVADCDLGTNGVTQVEGKACGPETVDADDDAYELAWEGTGNVRLDVSVVAS